MRTNEQEREFIRSYAESNDLEVIHLEKVRSETVGPARHDVWDVHCTDGRWWVVTNPAYLYSQNDFKSVEVVISFHVGLMTRVMFQKKAPVTEEATELLPGSWRRWEQAAEALSHGDEAEDFQAVGVRLRECLVSFVAEIGDPEMVPEGEEVPKKANVVAWSRIIADTLAAGSSSAKTRSYLKSLAKESWEYTNWLTHAKNATSIDAEFGVQAVSHALEMFTGALIETLRETQRCDDCGSYATAGGVCRECDWIDESYEPPEEGPREPSDEWKKHPCVPSSDISTLITPDSLGEELKPNRRTTSAPDKAGNSGESQ
ncbi:hypothetical protein [Streptomyces sp. NPDC017941]|uniref:hypothetical protein n=1 Tax=Streptomyces sp. NPDC017941 TaxID=3365018 RepID=UPI003797813F